MFPYADHPHSYWTGFFTSRARGKGLIRDLSRISHIADTIDAFWILEGKNTENILERFE